MSKLQEILKIHHPDLYASQFTEQFALSERILGFLFEYKLDQCQLADMLNLSLSEYLQMERGDSHIPIVKYQEAIRLFERRVQGEMLPLK